MININLDEYYTPNELKANEVAQLVKELTLLLPSIQFSINQKIHSITQVSPNMLVYGKNHRDILDYNLAIELQDEIQRKFENPSKYELVKNVEYLIKCAQHKQQINHEKYVKIMKNNFDIDKYDDSFEIGDIVAYYIGDRSATNRKIRQRFSGPWKIIDRLRHNTVKIQMLDKPEKILACHVSMLKYYHKYKFVPLTELIATEKSKNNGKSKNKNNSIKVNVKKSKTENKLKSDQLQSS